ncbi:MAG: hypothetical protein ABW003_02155, partial [Microvirga sp.]
LLGRGRHQLLQVPLGMNPAQGMRGNPELAGIIRDHDRVLHQPVMADRTPCGGFVQRLQQGPVEDVDVLDNGAKFAISFVHTIARQALRHRSTEPKLKSSA